MSTAEVAVVGLLWGDYLLYDRMRVTRKRSMLSQKFLAWEVLGPGENPLLAFYYIQLSNCLLNIYIYNHRLVLLSALA